ncbi:MAG: GUN4 domain-containing protein [Cyanobacteria bacterium P01_D01_bin.56]
MSSDAVTVFFSYSHADEALRNELAKHLSTLKRQRFITDWHDRKILPGDEWDGTIEDNLNTARVILLLISADFIASDYCYDTEIQKAMERHDAQEATVIPIILRSCDWSDCPFGKLQALPRNATAVKSWLDQDEAFTDIAKGIKKVVNEIRANNEVNQPVQITRDQTKRESQSLSKQEILILTRKPPSLSTSQTSAQEKYRNRLQEYLVRRKLTPLQEILLNQLRQELKLSESEAQQILSDEQAPLEKARSDYRNALRGLIEAGHYPIDEATRLELQELSESLQLPETEVKEIEQPILAAALEKARRTYRNALEELIAAGHYPIDEQTRLELKQLQQTLHLSTSAVDQLKKPILENANKEYFLKSEQGIDYSKLQNLLQAKDWKAADQETYEVMNKILRNEWSSRGLMNFPCIDLLSIDRLWVTCSDGKFGFSIQKEIYLSCGGVADGKYYEKAWQQFGDAVGWRMDGSWMSYEELRWLGDGPCGHMPCSFFLVGWSLILPGSLAYRLASCNT